MKQYHYLILGGGLTGDAAVRGIREIDPSGSIGLISQEQDPPYARPSLSKGLWKGRPIEKIWRNTEKRGAEMHLGRRAILLDPVKKTIQVETGDEFKYDKLLLATGGSPIRMPFGGENIIYFRDLQDYWRLRAISEHGEQFLVIGGGFIGSEIAAALTMIGKKVVMVFQDGSIGANIFPSDLSLYLNDYYRQKGVEVIPGSMVTALEPVGARFTVHTGSGQSFRVDGVVAGLGIRPNIALAQQAGLKVNNGIIVDKHLLTSAPDIYAAGDVANFYHAALHKHVRVEHEDNAITMGKLAGRNMAGESDSYTHIPMFYSDLFDLGYEAVGEVDSKLETSTQWKDPYKEGVIYCHNEHRVRGVLLWNVSESVPAARALLGKPESLTDVRKDRQEDKLMMKG